MQFHPLGDRVMVRPNEELAITKGGIVIPDNASEKTTEGVVMFVGPGRMLDTGAIAPMTVKTGDTVLWGKYAGSILDWEGQPMIVMREGELLGRIARVAEPAQQKPVMREGELQKPSSKSAGGR